MTTAFQSTTEEIFQIQHMLKFGRGYAELGVHEQKRRFDLCIQSGNDIFPYFIIIVQGEPTIIERVNGVVCWKHSYWSEVFHENGLTEKDIIYCIDYTDKLELDFALGFLTDKTIHRSMSFNQVALTPTIYQCLAIWSRRTGRLTTYFNAECATHEFDNVTLKGAVLSEEKSTTTNGVKAKSTITKRRKCGCVIQ
jgi:hypothetical protein